MRTLTFAILACAFFCSNLNAQDSLKTLDTTLLELEFPLFDFPYQHHASMATGNFFSAYANPSMKQSLAISNDLYSSAHWGIKKLIKTKHRFSTILLRNSVAMAFDYMMIYMPFGHSWVHEEYHRAVMTRRDINSFNDVNTFPFGSSVIYVKRVTDENLTRLCDEHNPDFRRMMVGGIEGQYYQVHSLQAKNFFYDQQLPHTSLYWLSTIGSVFYVNQSSSDSFNDRVDKMNEKDGANIAQRDFTGPDFTAWAYELFNPDSSYASRGVHPSGVGINRYIKPDQLSTGARNYLKKQGQLQWLNILTPHLYGFPRIRLITTEKGTYFGNFAVRHVLTPFGNDISFEAMLQTPHNKLFFALHNYNNYTGNFAGIEASWVDKTLIHDRLHLTGRTILWVQPDQQSFTSFKGRPGGLLEVSGSYGLGIFYPSIELRAKTQGWAIGNVFLEDNLSLSIGLNIRLR